MCSSALAMDGWINGIGFGWGIELVDGGMNSIYDDFRPIIASPLPIVAVFAYFFFFANLFIPKSTLAQKRIWR